MAAGMAALDRWSRPGSWVRQPGPRRAEPAVAPACPRWSAARPRRAPGPAKWPECQS